MSEVIHVGLYGDGSRNCRLRAEYISCDHAEECSLHRDGKCFCVTTLFGKSCPLGTVKCVDGGTKRSKAFRRVSGDVDRHEKRYALEYPHHDLVARIGEKVFLTLPYASFEIERDRTLRLKHVLFISNTLLEDKTILTPGNIKRICDFRPRNMVGDVISDYWETSVPMFFFQLSRLFPEEYEAFVAENPEYGGIKPNWVGRTAKLSTCNRTEEYVDYNGNVFRFDGEYVVCDHYRSAFISFDGESAQLCIKVTDDMKVKITSNDQVTPDTVFL